MATSVEGFVQQLAVCYVPHGYWWYVAGRIPARKDPAEVDAKLVERYDIGLSERARARRKQLGKANMQYLRYGRFFLLLATEGNHPFKAAERTVIRDIRRVPLRFEGYSISYRPGGRTRKGERDPRWHTHVEIQRETYKELKAYFVGLAVHRTQENLAVEFRRLPFEPYAPVRRQILNILRAVNTARRRAGFEQLPTSVLRLRRRVVKPFGPVDAGGYLDDRTGQPELPSVESVNPAQRPDRARHLCS